MVVPKASTRYGSFQSHGVADGNGIQLCSIAMNDRLFAFRLFTRIARKGSFSAASRELSIPQSTASRTIARLERDIGAALFVRTTRALTLTDVGSDFIARIEPALAEIHDAEHAEPRRVCRRLLLLRGWSDDDEEDGGELLAGGARAGGAADAGRRRGASDAVVGDQFGGRQTAPMLQAALEGVLAQPSKFSESSQVNGLAWSVTSARSAAGRLPGGCRGTRSDRGSGRSARPRVRSCARDVGALWPWGQGRGGPSDSLGLCGLVSFAAQ